MNLQKCKNNHSRIDATCTECKALIREWDSKLEQSGLLNIEQPDGNLKKWSSAHLIWEIRNGHEESMRSREEYYRAAGHFLWDHKFASDLERSIWELHARGMSALDISKRLNRTRNGKDTVLKIINRLADVMGAKCRS